MGFDKPDWYTSVILHGKHDSDHLPILVDEFGNLLSLMKGAYNSALKTIAVDGDGIMKANIAVQDIAGLTVREGFGSPHRLDTTMALDPGETGYMEGIEGRGTIYWGRLWLEAGASHKADTIKGYLDETLVSDVTWVEMSDWGLIPIWINLFGLVQYDDAKYQYRMGIKPLTPFDEYFDLTYINNSATTETIHIEIVYGKA